MLSGTDVQFLVDGQVNNDQGPAYYSQLSLLCWTNLFLGFICYPFEIFENVLLGVLILKTIYRMSVMEWKRFFYFYTIIYSSLCPSYLCCICVVLFVGCLCSLGLGQERRRCNNDGSIIGEEEAGGDLSLSSQHLVGAILPLILGRFNHPLVPLWKEGYKGCEHYLNDGYFFQEFILKVSIVYINEMRMKIFSGWLVEIFFLSYFWLLAEMRKTWIGHRIHNDWI